MRSPLLVLFYWQLIEDYRSLYIKNIPMYCHNLRRRSMNQPYASWFRRSCRVVHLMIDRSSFRRAPSMNQHQPSYQLQALPQSLLMQAYLQPQPLPQEQLSLLGLQTHPGCIHRTPKRERALTRCTGPNRNGFQTVGNPRPSDGRWRLAYWLKRKEMTKP